MADDTHDLDRSPTSGNPSVSAGARLAAPLAVAVGLFGVPFAVLAPDAGMTSAATLVMSRRRSRAAPSSQPPRCSKPAEARPQRCWPRCC
jgi:hypothetical protein